MRIPSTFVGRSTATLRDRIPAVYRRTHVHKFHTLYFIEDGEGTIQHRDARIVLTRGAVMQVAAGEPHDIAGLLGCDLWIIGFHRDALDGCMLRRLEDAAGTSVPLYFALRACTLTGASRRVPVPDQVRWSAHCSWLRESVAGPPATAGPLVSASLMNLIGIDLLRLYLEPGASLMSLWKSPIVEQMQRYIEMHYRFPISLKNVAVDLGYSRAYLTDLIRRQTGDTVLDWINARRMIDARKLLTQTVSPIAEISERCGFSEPNNFMRRFERAHAGLSPSAWRAATQGGVVAIAPDDTETFEAHWASVQG